MKNKKLKKKMKYLFKASNRHEAFLSEIQLDLIPEITFDVYKLQERIEKLEGKK